jgi:hypothetical protein
LEKAAFGLRPGEISPLIETPEGFVVVKCLRHIPADASKRFEEVRESLKKEVRDRLVRQEMVTLFNELKEQARPRVLWRPEGVGQPPAPRRPSVIQGRSQPAVKRSAVAAHSSMVRMAVGHAQGGQDGVRCVLRSDTPE